jgi:hypothetical protein
MTFYETVALGKGDPGFCDDNLYALELNVGCWMEKWIKIIPNLVTSFLEKQFCNFVKYVRKMNLSQD